MITETHTQRLEREEKERGAEKERLHLEVLGKTYKRLLSAGLNPVTGASLKAEPYYGTLGRA